MLMIIVLLQKNGEVITEWTSRLLNWSNCQWSVFVWLTVMFCLVLCLVGNFMANKYNAFKKYIYCRNGENYGKSSTAGGSKTKNNLCAARNCEQWLDNGTQALLTIALPVTMAQHCNCSPPLIGEKADYKNRPQNNFSTNSYYYHQGRGIGGWFCVEFFFKMLSETLLNVAIKGGKQQKQQFTNLHHVNINCLLVQLCTEML